MSDPDEKKAYDALAVPEEALARGGVELVRIAVNEDKLFLTTRPALKDPAEWGEILAELTRRLGVLYDMAIPAIASRTSSSQSRKPTPPIWVRSRSDLGQSASLRNANPRRASRPRASPSKKR